MEAFKHDIIERSRAFAIQKMAGLHSSHGWGHVERVVAMANRISETEPRADRFIVNTASILHDIARAEEDASSGTLCHAHLGSEIARTFLRDIGLDHDSTEHIGECILTHRFRKNRVPATLEAEILYDADKLDSIGAVGIGRAFLFSGEIGAKLHNHTSDIESTAAYSEEDTAYREYMVKLRHVKEKMLTNEGKRIAHERHDFMEHFFIRFRNEMNGK